MDTLATEILNKIFTRLHFRNKLECMLVCHRWAQIIREHCLLHTISITQAHVFTKFIQMVNDRPNLGIQIKHLILYDCIDKDFDKKRLTALFRNLRSLYLIRYPKETDSKNKELKSESGHSKALSSQIERLVDFEEADLSIHLLNSGLCSNLTSLVITQYFIDSLDNKLIPLLKNAPALLNLTIIHSYITLSGLEKIHGSLTSLQSLTLCHVRLTLNDIPSEPTPASSVTTLWINLCKMNVEFQVKLLQYIRKKYKSLAHFGFSASADNSTRPEMIEKFNKDGFKPLIQSLGPQLKSLESLVVPLEPEIFKYIDRFGCKLDKLEIEVLPKPMLPALIRSKQWKYIKKLSLYESPKFSFRALKVMKNLSSLELNFRYKTCNDGEDITYMDIDFNELIQMCPESLESLSIEDADIKCKSRENYNDADLFQSTIKNLTIIGPNLPNDINLAFGEYFVNLDSLTLRNCLTDLTSLALPAKVTYCELESKDDLCVEIVPTKDSTPGRFYHVKERGYDIFSVEPNSENHNTLLYEAVRPEPREKMYSKPTIKLYCLSLETLVLNNKLAC